MSMTSADATSSPMAPLASSAGPTTRSQSNRASTNSQSRDAATLQSPSMSTPERSTSANSVISGGSTGAYNSLSHPQSATPIHVVWASVRDLILSTGSTTCLPNQLFDPLYAYVARQVRVQLFPTFQRSREAAVYTEIMNALALPATPIALLPGRSIGGVSQTSALGVVPTAASALSTAGATGAGLAMLSPPLTLRQQLEQQSLPASARARLDAASNVVMKVADFERLGCIGQGSYGSVYVWRHRFTGVCYAVKEMSKRVLKHKASVHTVVRELACTLVVDSPYVCNFDFAFSDVDTVYMGMRMCWRGDLERWLLAQSAKRFDESVARFYAAQVVIALKHLHQAGVVHRDIKASNILIDEAGHVRLSDFGLAVLMHSCSMAAPSPERVCRGERSDVITHCCLGCLQVTKLKQLQSAATEATSRGLSPRAAGRAACDTVCEAAAALSSNGSFLTGASKTSVRGFQRTGPSSVTATLTGANTAGAFFVVGSSASGSAASGITTTTATESPAQPYTPSPIRSTPTSSSSLLSSMTPSLLPSPQPANAAAFSPNASMSMEAGGTSNNGGIGFTAGNANNNTANNNNYGSSRSLTGSLRSFFLPRVRATSGGTSSNGNRNQPTTGHPSLTQQASFGSPTGNTTGLNGNANTGFSAACESDNGVMVATSRTISAPPVRSVSLSAPIASATALLTILPRDVRDYTAGFQASVGKPVATAAAAAAAAFRLSDSPSFTISPSTPPLANEDNVNASANATAGDSPGSTTSNVPGHGNIIEPSPMVRVARFTAQSVVSTTVLMDCDCQYPHDDGTGWYKGRAGTSAYWAPQMIARDARGERIAYGAEADWWSFGCLVYCLMTGRSPFSSGMGSTYDNAMTLEGRLQWPRGVFSKECKDLISRLLVVDPQKRLGGGEMGWKDIQAHPWFAKVDWDLLEAKVLPAPCIPPYRMCVNLKSPPEKIEGQFRGNAAEEAAAVEATTRAEAAKLSLDSEDEAIFSSVTYTAPDTLLRGILKGIGANDIPIAFNSINVNSQSSTTQSIPRPSSTPIAAGTPHGDLNGSERVNERVQSQHVVRGSPSNNNSGTNCAENSYIVMADAISPGGTMNLPSNTARSVSINISNTNASMKIAPQNPLSIASTATQYTAPVASATTSTFVPR